MKLLYLAIFLFFFAFYTLIMGGHLYSPDEEIMFRTAESMAQFQGFAIQPLVPGGDRFTQADASGRYYGHYGLGQPLLAVPLYYFGTGLVQVIPADWNQVFRYPGRTLYENVTRLAVSRFNQVVTAVTCLLLFHFGIVLGYTKRAALLVTLIYGLATMAMPHAKTFFSEPLATLLLLFAFYSLYSYKLTNKLRWLLWSGSALGYAIFTRIDSIITVPLYLGYLLFGLTTVTPSRWFKSAVRPIIFWLIPIGLFCGLVALYNYVRFGSVTSTGYESEGLTFSYPLLDGLYGLLFSSGRSIFLFSPPILLFFIALKTFWQEKRYESYFCCAIAVVYLLFYAKWESWAGGWCWGPRHIFQIHIFLLIPVLALFEKYIRKPHSLFWAWIVLLTAVGMFVQITAILVSFMDYHHWLLTQVPALWYSLYIPAHSSLIGYWEIVRQGIIDLFFLQLWQSSLPIWIKSLPIVAVLILLFTGYYIVRVVSLEDNRELIQA
ncbi:MAG: hypothetical protein N3A72_02990 [bacterium]|nr:hypothetical protein [bacterium]